MTEWVHSLHHKAPFYVSSNNYTKIVVDQVLAADKKVYNVLLLATGTSRLVFTKDRILNTTDQSDT